MTVLVVGARGRIAAGVIASLVAADVPVRAVTSDPSSVRLPASVSVWPGSVREPGGLADALRGVRKVLLYADGGGVTEFLAALVGAGVAHVVLLSALTAREADGDGDLSNADSITMRHVMVERAIAESGIPWTFVRPGMFATNSLRWAADIRGGGAVRMARPGAQATPIHERDIVDVSVKALVEPGHEGARYAMTGPESLSQRDQVESIGAAIGQPVRVVEIPDSEAVQELARWSSQEVAERLVARLAVTDGVKMPVLVDTVERVLGRPALTFAEWAADHAADFS